MKDYVELTPMDSPKRKQITLGNSKNSDSRQSLIPFRNLHQKTHFRTIEHLMAKCEPKAQYERIPSPLPEISLLRNGSNQSLKSATKIQDHINDETKKINELELKYMDFNDRELLK